MAIGNLPPEILGQQQQLNRQQQMAQLLMQQGAQQPQGQMVSGRYVAPSFFQNILPLAQMYAGSRMAEKSDKQALDLATALRKQYADEIKEFRTRIQGVDGSSNPQSAYDFAASAYNPALQAIGIKKLTPEEFTLSEGAARFMTMPDGSTRQIAAGTKKPIQVDTGTTIEFRDASDPTKVLQVINKTQMPTAGQVVERDDGTFLVDTRTGQAKPVMGAGGQPLMGGGKPLTETQSNAVAFGARAIEADKIASNLEKKGVTNTGIIRTVAGGIVSQAPIVGEKLEQGVRSAFNPIPSVLGGPSGEQQQVDQARRNFITAVLRKESGAVISPTEYKDEERKYFPQIGDTDKTIEQKQEARRLAIKALEAQAGPSGTRQINKIVNEMGTGGTGAVVDFNKLPTGRK